MTRFRWSIAWMGLAISLLGGDRADATAVHGRGLRGGRACCTAPCTPCVPCDVVYEYREVQCFRPVYETLTRPCKFTRCRTEYVEEFQPCPTTVCETVYRDRERPYTCTEMKPVYSTVERPVCKTVCVPVTTWTTCCVDMGHWERPPAANGCCAPCPVWVPNIVEKRVPVTHYESRVVTEMATVQVCKLVPQQVTKFCKYIECATETKTVIRKIPRMTCRTVTETVEKQIPYTVCRQVPYTVRVCVPHCVPRPCASPCGASAAQSPVIQSPVGPPPGQTDVNQRLVELAGCIG